MADTIFPVQNSLQKVTLNVGVGGVTRFRFVKLSSGSAVLCASNERALGIALTTESSASSVEAILAGLQAVELGGDVSALDLVKSDSLGRAVAIDTTSVGGATQNVLGLAITGGGAGDLAQLLLTPGVVSDLDSLSMSELASTATGKGASRIGVEDVAGNYSANNVEAALAEAADDLSTLKTDLSSTATGEGAALVGIEDAAGNFDAADVEGALAEIWTDLSSTSTGEGAALVGIEDAAGNFDAADVEGALAEIWIDLSSTATGEGAALVGIEDPDDDFTATDVENALTELAQKEQAVVLTYSHGAYLGAAFPADITASVTDHLLAAAFDALAVQDVILSLEETGADASNPLEVEADVKIGGTSVLTTKPKITKAAADGANTAAGGAGVTQAVVKTNGDEEAVVGDRVTVSLNLTRTAPATEMAGVLVHVICSVRLPY